MREILFRGKRIDNREWVEGYYFGERYAERKHHLIMNTLGSQYAVDPETVGQFSGEFFNQKVFDGDVVRITNIRTGRSAIWSVVFKYGAFMFKQKGVDYYVPLGDFHSKNYYKEVIGNIHDNPELLQEGQV